LSKTADFKKILIYRIGHIGDTIVSLPAFWAIRKAFPDAEITLLTNINSKNSKFVMAKSVLPEKGLIDKWLLYPNDLSKLETAVVRLKLLIGLRLKGYDAVFYLMTRNRTAASAMRDEKFFRLSGIENIYGTSYVAENRLDENAPRPLPDVEAEDEFLMNCLPHDEFDFDLKAKPDLKLTSEEKSFAEYWLKQNCGADFRERKLVAVAPGSKWESKIWAEERFEKVVAKLIEKHDVYPVIFGGEEDREKGNRLILKWNRGANAAGELNIRQASAGLAHCVLYLGNDTGTMHLAAAVETTCVAVFAAIDYGGRWRPFGEKHIIFREKVECEACYLEVCPFENKCLTAISPERVFEACEKVLEEDLSTDEHR